MNWLMILGIIILIVFTVLRVWASTWNDGREKRPDEQYQWKSLILISWIFNLKDKLSRWIESIRYERIARKYNNEK